jgi:hypothetical protein
VGPAEPRRQTEAAQTGSRAAFAQQVAAQMRPAAGAPVADTAQARDPISSSDASTPEDLALGSELLRGDLTLERREWLREAAARASDEADREGDAAHQTGAVTDAAVDAARSQLQAQEANRRLAEDAERERVEKELEREAKRQAEEARRRRRRERDLRERPQP